MVQARAATAGPRSSAAAASAIRAASLAAIASTVLLATTTTAHPLCFFGPDRAVSMTAEPTFCPNDDPEGFCCEPDEEAAVIAKYDDAGALSEACAPLYKEVVCGVCSPYSAHLYTRMATEDGLAMTAEFCTDFVDACGEELALPATYCGEHVLDGDVTEYWSYPLDIDASFSDSDVNPAFPNLPEEILPPEPMAMHMTPDGTAWWIAGMAGYIKEARADDPDDAFDVLDISGKIEHSYEQGLMGFAFSPSFTTTGLFYVCYTIPGDRNPENAKNVLSKFVYHVGDEDATYDSEEVLITTSEKGSTVHSSGWVGFAPSSYKDPTGAYHHLYWTVGDGGPQNDPDDRAQDRSEYHGSVVRIAVPSDPSERGYDIPADNAFDGSDGERPEICAWGFRNPFRCGFDRDTDELYCGDVGQDAVEEVDIIECGKDYGWRMYEGDRCNDGYDDADDCSGLNREAYTFPTFQYCHFDYDSGSDEYDVCGDRTVTGLSVIGGYVYRGARYADVLNGHYIFADHSTGVLHHLAPSSGGGWTAGVILSSIPKVSGFAVDNDGEMYLIGYQGNIYDLPCGTLCEHGGESTGSSCMPQSDNIPTYEELGCFADGDPKAMSLGRAPACDTMNAEMCASYCATVDGAVYFAMEYQRECYCSGDGDDHERYGEIDEAECNMPCSGYPSERCGGDGTMNVYVMTGEGSPRASSDASSDVAVPTAENYLGCYADDEDDRALTRGTIKSDTMSVEECEAFCSEYDDATIFALEFGHECYCGTDESDYEYYGEVDTCDTPCIGDASTACGGRLSMSVYTMEGVDDTTTRTSSTGDDVEERRSNIEWYDSFYPSVDDDGEYDDEGYQGCYVDERGSRRVLKSKVAASDNMTVGRCRAFCEDSRIFGLEYGQECWCGDGESLNGEKLDDEDCDYECTGNPETSCGGYLRISVYKTSG